MNTESLPERETNNKYTSGNRAHIRKPDINYICTFKKTSHITNPNMNEIKLAYTTKLFLVSPQQRFLRKKGNQFRNPHTRSNQGQKTWNRISSIGTSLGNIFNLCHTGKNITISSDQVNPTQLKLQHGTLYIIQKPHINKPENNSIIHHTENADHQA